MIHIDNLEFIRMQDNFFYNCNDEKIKGTLVKHVLSNKYYFVCNIGVLDIDTETAQYFISEQKLKDSKRFYN